MLPATRRRLVATAITASSIVLVATPVADAALSKAEKRQNAAISKNSKANSKNARGLLTVGKSVKSAATAANKAIADAKAANDAATAAANKAAGAQGGVDTLFAGLPQVIDGLGQLRTGLTAAGAGLTTLGSAYTSVEYGVGGITATGASAVLAAGGTVTSADIPDDGNTIHAGDQAVVVAGAAGAMSIDLKASIRSAESDGATADLTAGQAGGFVSVIDADASPAHVSCGGTPSPPGIMGTVAGDSIVTPAGTVTNLPLKNLPGGNLRTSTAAPATSLLPAACQFAAVAGHTYLVNYSLNFIDIPTTTTPGPTE